MDRLEAFERMLEDTKAHLTAVETRMQSLKEQGKEKSATYRQLMGDKMQLKALLDLYRLYDLL